MASYEKHANGTWSVRFYCVENFETVKKRLRGYKTKKEAENAYLKYKAELEEEKNLKISKQGTRLIFSDLFEEYCEFHKQRIKSSSFYDFDSKSRIHILPFFENYIVSEISPRLLLKWQNSIDHYSFKYKTNIRGYLSGILKYAQRYYNIPNQLQNVDNFKNKQETIKEMQVWSEDEFKTFISKADKLEFKAFFSALYLTGCRKGELLATNWNDWDLTNNTLNINKTITRKVHGRSWTITPPKNIYSVRKISITQQLSDLMKEYKDYQQQKYDEINFVFGSKSPFADTNIIRYLTEVCSETGLKRIRIHDFRHSHASFLISKGLSIVAVAKRLGHKDIEQTLNTYAHLLKSDESKIIDKLDSILI